MNDYNQKFPLDPEVSINEFPSPFMAIGYASFCLACLFNAAFTLNGFDHQERKPDVGKKRIFKF